MLLFKDNDLLLKDNLPLYDNLAKAGKFVGRLNASLQIHPAIQLTWDFEIEGDPPDLGDNSFNESDFLGKGFSLDGAVTITRRTYGGRGFPGFSYAGIAPQSWYGSRDFRATAFKFFIPNATFHERAWEDIRLSRAPNPDVAPESKFSPAPSTNGKAISVAIDDWQVDLITVKESLRWLKPKNRNFGTRLTTIGQLYQRKTANETSRDNKSMTIQEARNYLVPICTLLSFANGGYTYPMVIEGIKIDDTSFEAAGVVSVYNTTPLELLGHSWVSDSSSIGKFLECVPAFRAMLSLPHWERGFSSILTWYFQAIQPQSGYSYSRPWPVVANALGAALELLAYSICEQDMGKRFSSRTTLKEKIGMLLDTIGTRSQFSYDHGLIEKFVNIRNDATHAKQKASISYEQRNEVLSHAIQWVEEALLWRLGYDGSYGNRLSQDQYSMLKRYDLSKRPALW